MLFKVPKEKRIRRDWKKQNPDNMKLLQRLDDIASPAVKQHLQTQKEDLMLFIRSQYGGVDDPFELPVCGHCERWCSWHDKPPGSAYCWSCGTVTPNPITVEQWFENELRIKNIYDRLKKQFGIDYLGEVEPISIGPADEEDMHPEIIIAKR